MRSDCLDDGPRRPSRRVVLGLVGLLHVAGASETRGQAVFEQFNFQFAFSTPGARAKGLGGAFVALADDASAAETNPGGLALVLRRREASFEIDSSQASTPRLAARDSLLTGATVASGDRITAPAFASMVFRPGASRQSGGASSDPQKGDSRLSLTLFAQTFLNYRESFQLQRRAVPETSLFFLPLKGTLDLKGRSFGAAGGVQIGERLGLGLSLRASILQFDTQTERGDIFLPDLVTNVQEINDDDWAVGATAGVLWKIVDDPKRPAVRAGVAYTYNPAFTMTEQFDQVAGTDRVPVPGFPRELTISIPDRLAVGVSAHWDRLVLSAELDWDRYSELSGDSTSLIPDIDGFRRSDFQVRDVTSVHFGGEYQWPVGRLVDLKLRGGLLELTLPPVPVRRGRRD